MQPQPLLDQVAPSVLLAPVRGPHDPRIVPAAVVASGVAAAYQTLCRTGRWMDLVDIPLRQGDRTWLGEVTNERSEWETCAIDFDGAPDLPGVRPRWSRTIGVGERVVAVLATETCLVDPDATRGELAAVEGVVDESFPPLDEHDFEPYERTSRYFAARFRGRPPSGALVFDAEGLLAGCIEQPRDPKGDSRIVIPGEWLTGYATFHWMFALLRLGGMAPDSLDRGLELFEKRRDRIDDPRLYCAAHDAYGKVQRPADAVAALRRAHELEPDNPWVLEHLRDV
jgi:hypothetical protein